MSLPTRYGTVLIANEEENLLWQLAVESPMRDLIGGLRVGVAGVMPDAKCEIAKRNAFAVTDKAQNHAELAARGRQVDLEAGRELRAVAAFRIATAKLLDLYTVSLEPAASLPQRLGPGTTASHRVLGEGALVEEDAGMTPPDGQAATPRRLRAGTARGLPPGQ